MRGGAAVSRRCASHAGRIAGGLEGKGAAGMRGGGDSVRQEPAGVVCGEWRVRDDRPRGSRCAARLRATAFHRLRSGSTRLPRGANHLASAGEPFLDLLLRRGHYCDTPVDALRDEARESLAEARASLDAQAKPFGGWEDAQRQLAALHPPASATFDRFAEVWTARSRGRARARPGELAGRADSLRADSRTHPGRGAAALLPVLSIARGLRSPARSTTMSSHRPRCRSRATARSRSTT